MAVETDRQEHPEDPVPLCLHCLEPVDPLAHYCPQCGEAVGQLTPYIPFVNIRWSTQIWSRMWQQTWSRQTSILGRVFRLLVIVWFVPVLLVGLIPRLWRKRRGQE